MLIPAPPGVRFIMVISSLSLRPHPLIHLIRPKHAAITNSTQNHRHHIHVCSQYVSWQANWQASLVSHSQSRPCRNPLPMFLKANEKS